MDVLVLSGGAKVSRARKKVVDLSKGQMKPMFHINEVEKKYRGLVLH